AVNANIAQNIPFELAVVQTRDPADGPLTITQDEVNDLGIELEQWLGFTLDVESYIVAARALAGSGSGFAYAGEWASSRPGVSVSRSKVVSSSKKTPPHSGHV
ncbi:MAG: hypothetical protein ACOCWT_04340, partial [Desulfohalobiaceae bacterium]